MQLTLTRKLIRTLCLSACLAAPVLQASEPTSSLTSADQANYLAELKALYLTENERKALLAHANSLLQTYALRAAYQVGQAQRQDRLYQLQVSAPGELLLREEVKNQSDGSLRVSNQRINLYGVDPYLQYECPPSGISCVVRNPHDGTPLLSIVRDHKGAAELAKALSFLIRNLQKG
jgi:hypothetical protein